MGNKPLQPVTAGSQQCSDELDAITATMDNFDIQADSVLTQTPSVIDFNQIAMLKHELEELQCQMDSLNERHSMSQRSDVKNLTTRRKALAKRIFTLLGRCDEEQKKMTLTPGSKATIQNIESQPKWNGQEVVIVGSLLPNGRYNVQVVSSSLLLSLKPNNLLPVNVASSSGEQKTTVGGPPAYIRQVSDRTRDCNQFMEALELKLADIETRVRDIFVSGISPSGVHSDRAGKIKKLNVEKLKIENLFNSLDGLTTQFSVQERSQAENLRARRRALSTRTLACDDDIVAKLHLL